MTAFPGPVGFSRSLLLCSIVSALVTTIFILYLGFTATCGYGNFGGIGVQNETLEISNDPESLAVSLGLMFFIAMALYSGVLVCIKSAVCILFLRIAGPIRSYRACIFGIFIVTVVGFVVTEAGTMGECRPIEASWKGRFHGECASRDTVVIIATFSTVARILTDWLCALFPAYMLWRTLIPVRKKLAAGVVLGLSALASICTLLRIPYIMDYNAALVGHSKNGVAYDLGGLLIWSVLECGIGLIAMALPPIWHTYRVQQRARIHQVLPDDEAGAELPVFNRPPKHAYTIRGREAGSIERG
ncbi:hypothetical protein PG994_007855 [Apiospora phragmitis]|uniref:Rhodopsin domain-containing protein n=1 Tax=Apiospora phragmitis TaxID=2905665 RepID=A0ABR1UUH1_9PEZI